jgi:uncharacterized membrane protein YgcG
VRLLRAVAALVALAAAATASAEERIHRYVSDVTIQKDGSLDVTETIDVAVENVRINHGIFRDFPTRYQGRHGNQVRVGFDWLGATLDGRSVPSTVEAAYNGVRIKVGDADSYVPTGDHRYTLHYRTTRQLGRFKDFDELYWNATGNGWEFPIDVAEARLRLPSPARFGQRAMYSGPQGSTASNAEVYDERPGEIAFRTTQSLGANEGLTVAAAFPKGIVAAPDAGSRFANWLADNGPPAVGGLALIAVLAFYFYAWRKVGRDPPAGTVVPIFAPADDLSPAAMRYVKRMDNDNRTFAAALIDMGVKGHVRLIQEEGGWFASDKTRIERTDSETPLPDEERAALTALVEPGSSIMMEQKNHSKFRSAQNMLSQGLKTKYEGVLFNKNWGWAIAGVVVFAAAVWLVCAAIVAATGFAASSLIWPLVAGAIAIAAAIWAQRASTLGKVVAYIGVFVLGITVIGGVMTVFNQALATGWLLPFLPLAAALPVVVSAFAWIDAPTKEGRAVLDRIAGFQQYLSITERERLDRMTPPADTPELFERYLPYAIALGVENRWAERFAGILAAAAAQGQQGMGWYSGSHSPWTNAGSFANDVGSALTSAVSSASTAPGSRSGSGGGGSSGGGGGGGGGGGW